MYDEKFKEILENNLCWASKTYDPVYAVDELLKLIAEISDEIRDNKPSWWGHDSVWDNMGDYLRKVGENLPH